MSDVHDYALELQWTGNTGDGTRTYRGTAVIT
jgi:hypothetical protein